MTALDFDFTMYRPDQRPRGFLCEVAPIRSYPAPFARSREHASRTKV